MGSSAMGLPTSTPIRDGAQGMKTSGATRYQPFQVAFLSCLVLFFLWLIKRILIHSLLFSHDYYSSLS